MAKRILIVEDEADMVVIMKFILERNGFEVVTAYDGEEGLKKARGEKFDLIILDVLMPKLFGDDMATALRQDINTMSTPILFLTNLPLPYITGIPGKEDLQQDKQGNWYLNKSCEEESLLTAIRHFLPA
jgi:CheY-like chemotaxis protein